ncbi:MAG: NlpC/P60 family protein [Chthoniobacteraceae bacterium]
MTLLPASAQESSTKKKASTSKKATPKPSAKKNAATPKASSKTTPKSSPSAKTKAKATPKSTSKSDAKAKGTPEVKPSATPEPKPEETSPPPEELPLPGVEKAEGESDPSKAADVKKVPVQPLPGVISTDELKGFSEQPERVKKMIAGALELSKRGLVYKYGSADPAQGGMDCSGSIYYLLSEQGYKNVPRDASGQYVWARKNGEFFAVISKKADSFEFSDLKPGDLLFWNGTYKVDRDPPVTHSMIYLGLHAKTGKPVMWGASDGRSYEGKARWGVGVFDFKMPRTGANASTADFLGYARIPDPESATKPADAKAD